MLLRLIVVFCTFFLHLTLHAAHAGVTVFDDVSPVNNAVAIRALTKGRFFPEGGRLTDFYVDGKHIGTVLSGGDGYAFLRYVPSSAGVLKLKVTKDDETDEGVLLITEKKDRVILIAIENNLFESLFSLGPSEEGKNAVQQLSKRFRIIYLTTLLGVQESRKWIRENEFPLSPVLQWEGADMVAGLQEKNIHLYAIVGTQGMLSEARTIKKRYSFQAGEDAEEVSDWDDLLKHLQ